MSNNLKQFRNLSGYQVASLGISLNIIRDHCFSAATLAGWRDTPREDGTELCLIHSEISEAMEGARTGAMDDKLPHRPMLEVELADAIIRICDFAGSRGLDIGGALVEKLQYNQTRADHKREARESDGGKKW